MIQRNKELDEEAQKIYKSYHEKRDKAKFNETKKPEKVEKPTKATKQATPKPSKEEEEMLKLAIQESLAEEEERQKAIAFEKEILQVNSL